MCGESELEKTFVPQIISLNFNDGHLYEIFNEALKVSSLISLFILPMLGEKIETHS